MIRHLILVRTDEPEPIDAALDRFEGLADKVDGLERAEVVRDSSGKSGGYDRMAIMDFADEGALGGWSGHPEHPPIRDALRQHAQVLIFDYPLGTGT